MARWEASGQKKDCEECRELQDPKSFERGARVRIAGLGDCSKCPNVLNAPIESNENIIFLYNSLPLRFDSLSGQKVISAGDIDFVFRLYRVHPDLQEDYYKRLMYFHGELIEALGEKRKAEEKRRKEIEDWKRTKMSKVRI